MTALEKLLAGAGTAWPESRRREALSLARSLELPGRRTEGWRLTDLAALYAQRFDLAGQSRQPEIDAWKIPGTSTIVFVDGRFSAALSDLQDDPAVSVAPLGLESTDLHAHFGVLEDSDVFAALNSAHFEDCAWVRVKGEARHPVHILHLGTQPGAAWHPRCVAVLEENARATLIEQHVGSGWCNATTEIAIGAGAGLKHVVLQQQDEAAFHVGRSRVGLGRDADYDAVSVSLGARVSRFEQGVVLSGPGASVKLSGLSLTGGRQVSDARTRIDHAAPDCTSVQRHKCIADGASSAVFSGNVVVHRGASGTNSNQSSRNLLLSGRAKIDAQPQLEILNDDVSCRHGATVGRIDAEELFYLRSRGLGEAEARRLLICAFAAEIVDRIPVKPLREALSREFFGRLS